MNNKAALFFTAPFPSKFIGMPIGLLYLATEFEKSGFETHLIDLASNGYKFNLTNNWKEIVKNTLNSVKKDIVFIGITTTSPGLYDSLNNPPHPSRCLTCSKPVMLSA